MSGIPEIPEAEVERFLTILAKDAKAGGYFLNPDSEFTRELARGLLINQRRYGYPSCPCRLAEGEREQDLDIICPCDYRDADVNEFNACYCALYVSEALAGGAVELKPVPERRVAGKKARSAVATDEAGKAELSGLKYPVWRCRVCGYLCARDNPPGICPICKATQERFERFL